jgi:kynurenine formamidase
VTSLADSLLKARAYDLEQPRFAGAPSHPVHEPGVLLHLHRRHEPGTGEARTGASGLLVMTEHSGTHIDALCHQAENMAMHGGIAIDPTVQTFRGFTALGTDTIAPLIARGVLLDLGSVPAGHLVSADELEAAAEEVEIREGDVVLVRLGCGALWEDRPAFEAAGGMDASASRWLAERRPRAGGAAHLAGDRIDNVDPELGTLPGHTLLIVRAGIHIIEMLYLEELARDGVREFAFVCLPLKVRGGTGSPVRPIALA